MNADPEPRGRMFQSADFSVEDVAGRQLEGLRGVLDDDEERDAEPCSDVLDEGPFCFLFRVAGLPWQRFFFDAGVGFWEEWDEQTLDGELASPSVDYARLHDLSGRIVRGAVCGDRDDTPGLCFSIGLDDGREFVVFPTDPTDPDSKLEVKMVPG